MGDWSSTTTQTTTDNEGSSGGPGGQHDVLTQVTGVLVTTTMSQTELMIAWDAQADATTYDIEHRTGSGNWITTTATTTPAMLTGLTASTEYEIGVRAKNATEIGDWSSTITQTTLDPPPPPDPDPALAQVTGVSVTTTMSQTELMIAWDT